MDDDLPRVRGDSASRLAGEPLDAYSQDELLERGVKGLLETLGEARHGSSIQGEDTIR